MLLLLSCSLAALSSVPAEGEPQGRAEAELCPCWRGAPEAWGQEKVRRPGPLLPLPGPLHFVGSNEDPDKTSLSCQGSRYCDRNHLYVSV